MGTETLLGFGQTLTRFKQCLAGNAPDAKTRSPEGLLLLDARHVEPQLRSPNGSDVSAGPCPDYHKVMLCVSHKLLFARKRIQAFVPRTRAYSIPSSFCLLLRRTATAEALNRAVGTRKPE